MRTVYIQGASDDLIEVGSSDGVFDHEFNVFLEDKDYVVLVFSDDSVLNVTYDGCWRIEPNVIAKGTGYYKLYTAVRPEDDEYSDKVELWTNAENVTAIEYSKRRTYPRVLEN